MEFFGFLILAVLFGWAAINHATKHAAMTGYTASKLPEKLQRFAFLGGWPTSIYLFLTFCGVAAQQHWGLWMAAAFMAVTQVIFHNDLDDPGTWKHFAIIGALLALIGLT